MANDIRQEIINSTFESLLLECSHRTGKSLEVIKKVCDNQVKAKRIIFTIAEIGRLSQAIDGPKEQTIRNDTKPAKAYRTLISAYESAYQAKQIAKLGPNGAEQLIASIEDHRLRIQMMDLLAENKLLKNQVKQQQLALNAPTSSDMHGNPISNNLDIELNSIEIRALSDFISESNQKEHGLSISGQGQVLDRNGNAITKRAFVDAIEKLTTISGQNNLRGSHG
jgi:hypothetical protein